MRGMNDPLNIGGIVGVVIGACVGAGLAVLIAPNAPAINSEFDGEFAELFLGCLVIGGLVANKLWDRLVKKS